MVLNPETHSPDKVLAVTAERRLLEESRNKSMVFDIVHVLLLECTLSASIPQRQLVVGIVVLRQHVIVGHVEAFFLVRVRLADKSTRSFHFLICFHVHRLFSLHTQRGNRTLFFTFSFFLFSVPFSKAHRWEFDLVRQNLVFCLFTE